MNALRDIIIAQIVADGPMSVAEYMTLCLLHPRHGYYTTADSIGRAGDFTTAPEISQMYGELLGLALAQAWLDQDRAEPMQLVELGPGRGTLMRDALRAMTAVPGLAPQVHLVEASPKLRDLQAQTLQGYAPQWHDRIEDVPDGPIFLIANEFFDALPIRQFVRANEGWHERRVGILNHALAFGLGGEMPVDALKHRLEDTSPGQMVEFSPALTPLIGEIDLRLARDGGAAIIVDYGDWHSRGDTFQAVRDHGFADPLADPGRADLTAHVDFEAIARSVDRCTISEMIPQSQLLSALGIEARAKALDSNLHDLSARQSHHAGLRRLTDPDEMGTLFKAVALWPRHAPPVAGFAPWS